ncbi:MAG: hypothetical protein RSA64_07420 [Christensenellaceae bacterium]
MSESKITFGLTEDGDVAAFRNMDTAEPLLFRVDLESWGIPKTFADVDRANLISEEEAMRRTSGVAPDFSIWDNHK